MDTNKTFSQLLGLTSEWQVSDVGLDMEQQRVQIAVEWIGGNSAQCPDCGHRCPVYDFREERSWRHLDTMQFVTVVTCRTPRCRCPEHGVLTVKAPWADKHSRFTLMFESFAIRVLQACSNVEAARKLLGLSWQQADDIRTRAVQRGLDRRAAEPIERLGLDEKSFGKHHDYISVLTDLDEGRVLDVVAGRKQVCAEQLLLSLSAEQRAWAFAVAMDMWPAFMNAAAEHLPQATIVHDKFHVVKHLGDAVDKVRKQEHAALLQSGDDRLTGAKYLFLKNPDRMKGPQRERFEQLRTSGLKSARAWAIKDMFSEFWTFDFRQDAEQFFKDWYSWAVRCRLKPMKDKAKMLKKHLPGLLGYSIHQITNAVTEGLNSKIQNIKSSARGFRSFARYRIAILFYCGKLDMMPDLHSLPQKS